jgi:hypothetical protein
MGKLFCSVGIFPVYGPERHKTFPIVGVPAGFEGISKTKPSKSLSVRRNLADGQALVACRANTQEKPRQNRRNVADL